MGSAVNFMGSAVIFIQIVIAIIIFQGFVFLLNFFRDKYITKESISKEPHIIDLLSILNKIFYLSGLGFIVSNIIEAILYNSMSNTNWQSLSFGIILIFIGIGLGAAKKVISTKE